METSKEQNNQTIDRISYSSLSTWNTCAFKFKIEYIDKKREDIRNIYIDFGGTLHSIIERDLQHRDADLIEDFNVEYDKRITESRSLFPERYKDVNDETWKAQAAKILNNLHKFFDEQFPGYEVVAQEEEMILNIENTNFKFKGIVDLVIKYKNKYWVLDVKSASWGWNSIKRQDEHLHMQLHLYKHFWAKKHNIELKKINVGFLLMKRTAKEDNNIELFRVSGSPAKLQNALDLLDKAIYSIEQKLFIKNRFSCNGCPYFKTELCP